MLELNLNKLSVNDVKLLNNISEEIKDDFHSLIEQLYCSVENNVFWNVNILFSRNNFQSNLFLNLCYLELIKQRKASGYTKIVVKKKKKKIILKDFCNKNRVKLKYNFNFLHFFKFFLKPIFSTFNCAVFSFNSFLAKNTKRKNIIKLLKHKLTLIDLFITPQEFKNSKYISRHYPKSDFWNLIPDEKKKETYFIPEIVGTKRINKIILNLENSDENFIFKCDFLMFSDYFKAIFFPLFNKKNKFNDFVFKGFNIGPLLNYEYYYNLNNGNSFKGILNYYFFKRLKDNDINLNLVVNWFENQMLDRGFNFGVRSFYPKIFHIGFQPFIQALNYSFHLCPTVIEANNKVIPKQIVVIGEKLKNPLSKFFKNLNIISGPSIRYRYIRNTKNQTNYSNRNIILVALPISIIESRDILKIVSECIIEYPKLKFYIKPHPDLNMSLLINEFRDFFVKVYLVNDSIQELLRKSKILITNGSSVAMESLSLGVPVSIIASSNGIAQNPIPNQIDNEFWSLCYTKVELVNFINTCLKKDFSKNINFGKKIIDGYFNPVNKESIMSFLKFNK